jgi:2',3'-cyclic-nucleotide 2'-phosphodiesterase
VKVLFIGDIVGSPGRSYVADCLPELMRQRTPDLVVANGENATHGKGLTQKSAEELYDAGVEIITMGNHTWDQREIFQFIDEDARIVRPCNYPEGTPGAGYTICRVKGRDFLIVNAMGRTFLSVLDDPFRAVQKILEKHPTIRHILVDFHAEVTSEKLAMGWFLDGRASIVVGTHTHVPTADARVLPKGTGYLTDVGMVGPRNGILGMNRDVIIQRFLNHMPAKFEVAEGPRQFCAVEFVLDDESGRCLDVTPIFMAEST